MSAGLGIFISDAMLEGIGCLDMFGCGRARTEWMKLVLWGREQRGGITHRNDDTRCGSCCDAFQRKRFPLLRGRISSLGSARGFVGYGEGGDILILIKG